MIFPSPLTAGTLIRRYKRFLADVRLADGSVITVHCPNSGSMLSCSRPDSEVYLSRSANPLRKYPHTLEMVKVDDTWVGINTSLTNSLVEEGIRSAAISELRNADSIRREVKTSKHSRLDLLLTRGEKEIFIEVKSCTLAQDRSAMFPDAVTARGTKHLLELARLIDQGKEAVIFFLVQRMDADQFRPASHIDPVYAKTLADVHARGVRILVYQARVTPEHIEIAGSLPYSLGPFS